MKKGLFLAVITAAVFLLGGCGEQKADQSAELQAYIEENLPESYVTSPLYELSVAAGEKSYTAQLSLDMSADGSDYTGFGEGDYRELAELEASYLLTGCLSEPPVSTAFTLRMLFDEETQVVVEKPADSDSGTLTYGGETDSITF